MQGVGGAFNYKYGEVKKPVTTGYRFFMCAQHGCFLVGEIPIRGLIVPTVSQEQGCPR